MFVTIKGKQAMNLKRSGGGKKGTKKIISICIKKLQKKLSLHFRLLASSGIVSRSRSI